MNGPERDSYIISQPKEKQTMETGQFFCFYSHRHSAIQLQAHDSFGFDKSFGRHGVLTVNEVWTDHALLHNPYQSIQQGG
ncbi:MAG: hypothetical protein HQL99_13215 [Magnetococcales bacterium]|nr:hypothetical protein [Magnetococcales bacterium]